MIMQSPLLLLVACLASATVLAMDDVEDMKSYTGLAGVYSGLRGLSIV